LGCPQANRFLIFHRAPSLLTLSKPMKHSHCLILSLSLFLLAGCATVSPAKLGISQADWEEYSPTKQEELISAYEKTQATKRKTRAQLGSGILAVKIEGGTVLLPPYTAPTAYESMQFTMREGDCHIKIPVVPTDSDKKGKLEACYKDNTLYLDPSPYEPDLSLGSLQFPYMPIWKRGFTYPNVSSNGLLKLKSAQISLHALIPSNEN
jgi:hypothetical protein